MEKIKTLPPINRVSSSKPSTSPFSTSLIDYGYPLPSTICTHNKLQLPSYKLKTPSPLPQLPLSYMSNIPRPPPLDLSYTFSVVPSPPHKILSRTQNSHFKTDNPTHKRLNFSNYPVHKKNLFMSHTWRYDELNRDTHERVKLISNALKELGYTTWFDEDDMVNGNIDISMAEGIDNCDCFIVCLTKNYIKKINEASKNMLIRDNCYKEFNYANVSNKIMIPLILEPEINRLSGIIGLYLGNQYFIDFSFSDFKSKAFYDSIEKLDIALKKYKIIENSIKKHTEQISKFKSKLYSSI